MAINHRCKDNDHIAALAAKYKLRNWETLWKANAKLQQVRANPNLLFKGDARHEGDTVEIPEAKDKKDGGATETAHKYIVPAQKLFLRLRILNERFQPVTDAPFTLLLPDGVQPIEGKTDANGQIEQEISRTAQRAVLTIRVKASDTDPPPKPGEKAAGGAALRGDVPIQWTLQIGKLNPIEEYAPTVHCVSGVQQRLNNLCINAGPVDGILGPNTQAAVTAFQKLFGLDETGVPDILKTQNKLFEVHDKPDSIVKTAPAGAAAGT